MGEAWSWIRETILAGGLIATLITVLVLMTGTWPPMVVIESNSMQHDVNGEVGSIDAGDLVAMGVIYKNRAAAGMTDIQVAQPIQGQSIRPAAPGWYTRKKADFAGSRGK